MTLLQFIIALSAVSLLIISYDLYKRRRITWLHTGVFISTGIALLVFSFNQSWLDSFWSYFGIARGADLIVYMTLLFLWYITLQLYQKNYQQDIKVSQLISALAQKNSQTWKYEKSDQFVFFLRAYNEAPVIEKSIESIIKAWYHHILIVNDGSTDQTENIIKTIQKKYPSKIILLSHPINTGAWAATKTWFSYLQKTLPTSHIERIVTFDPDGQMDVSDIKNFTKKMKENPSTKIFLWSRFLKKGHTLGMPLIRRIILRGAKIVTKIFNNISLTDPHCWYRIIHKETIPLLDITSDWMAYASELVNSIAQYSISYQEVPVTIQYTPYSIGKWQKNRNAFKIIKELVHKKII